MKYVVGLVVAAVILTGLQALEVNSQSEDDMLDGWLDELTASMEQLDEEEPDVGEDEPDNYFANFENADLAANSEDRDICTEWKERVNSAKGRVNEQKVVISGIFGSLVHGIRRHVYSKCKTYYERMVRHCQRLLHSSLIQKCEEKLDSLLRRCEQKFNRAPLYSIMATAQKNIIASKAKLGEAIKDRDGIIADVPLHCKNKIIAEGAN